MFTRSNNKTRPFSPRVLCLMLKIRRRETKILGDFGVELGQTLFSGGGEKRSGVCRVLTGDDEKKDTILPQRPSGRW